jgi:DNA invertase Pin-like site-specific DNA recombinase
MMFVMKKKVFAYLRTSNLNSKIAIDGDSKDRQLKKIKSFCRSKSWQIDEIFYDCSVSGDNGTDLSERDEWNKMMARMKSNGVKTFVVADQSRFSRSILTAEIMKQDCRENTISAFDASTGNDLAISKNENPEVALINNLLQAISEYDKLKVVQRLQSGRRRAKKMGKSIGGNRPYGSNDQEIALISRIKEFRNRAVHSRISIQKICDRLNEEGFRTRKGTLLQRIQIRNIIERQKIS